MSNQNRANQSEEVVSDFFMPDKKEITRLQAILSEESGYSVPLEDVEEIGVELITLFECLARDKKIMPMVKDHENGG
ncbi:MAG: hypothetical protein ACHQT9_02965 [Candidatus Saccharimonadales bacterium]